MNSNCQTNPADATANGSWKWWFALVAGICLGQFALFAQSFCGGKILAATDLLHRFSGMQEIAENIDGLPQSTLLIDPIQEFYPWMLLASRELHQGRMPLWNPYSYCGTPLLANNQSAIFSPFNWAFFKWPDPHLFVWIQLARALTGGVGAYAFVRLLGIRPQAALLAGWLFPLCGFQMAWLFHPHCSAFAIMPATFWAVERLIQRPTGMAGPFGAIIVALNLVTGHLETTAHVLVAAGMYWGMRLFCEWRIGSPASDIRKSALVTIIAGIIGAAIGAVQILPTWEYVQSSNRIQQRLAGKMGEEIDKPYLEVVRMGFPKLFGTYQPNSTERVKTILNEGGLGAYVGYGSLFLLAPIGICFRDRFYTRWIWLILFALFAAPLFQIPVLGMWHNLPFLEQLRAPRAIMISGWSALILACFGLNFLLEVGKFPRRIIIAFSLLTGCLALRYWSISGGIGESHLTDLPQPYWQWFRENYMMSAVLCFGWLFVLTPCVVKEDRRSAVVWTLVFACQLELIVTFLGYAPQVNPKTFYPTRDFPFTKRDPLDGWRVCGMGTFMCPELGAAYGYHDVRGFDGVDPLFCVELLRPINQLGSPPFGPLLIFGSTPSPILDMLAVREVQVDPNGPYIRGWAPKEVRRNIFLATNENALRRAFVPRAVRTITNREERLKFLHDPKFNPREMAILSEPCDEQLQNCQGSVKLSRDEPSEVTIEAELKTEALVVLSDTWTKDWKVTIDGNAAESRQTNHLVRGVVCPAGTHTIHWHYEPRMFFLGRNIAYGSLAILTFWIALVLIFRFARAKSR